MSGGIYTSRKSNVQVTIPSIPASLGDLSDVELPASTDPANLSYLVYYENAWRAMPLGWMSNLGALLGTPAQDEAVPAGDVALADDAPTQDEAVGDGDIAPAPGSTPPYDGPLPNFTMILIGDTSYDPVTGILDVVIQNTGDVATPGQTTHSIIPFTTEMNESTAYFGLAAGVELTRPVHGLTDETIIYPKGTVGGQDISQLLRANPSMATYQDGSSTGSHGTITSVDHGFQIENPLQPGESIALRLDVSFLPFGRYLLGMDSMATNWAVGAVPESVEISDNYTFFHRANPSINFQIAFQTFVNNVLNFTLTNAGTEATPALTEHSILPYTLDVNESTEYFTFESVDWFTDAVYPMGIVSNGQSFSQILQDNPTIVTYSDGSSDGSHGVITTVDHGYQIQNPLQPGESIALNLDLNILPPGGYLISADATAKNWPLGNVPESNFMDNFINILFTPPPPVATFLASFVSFTATNYTLRFRVENNSNLTSSESFGDPHMLIPVTTESSESSAFLDASAGQELSLDGVTYYPKGLADPNSGLIHFQAVHPSVIEATSDSPEAVYVSNSAEATAYRTAVRTVPPMGPGDFFVLDWDVSFLSPGTYIIKPGAGNVLQGGTWDPTGAFKFEFSNPE